MALFNSEKGKFYLLPDQNQYGIFGKIQLVVNNQCCLLIGWATTRLYVIAHYYWKAPALKTKTMAAESRFAS